MISDWIEKLGRAVFEAPFGGTRLSNESPELAEIRLAVFDEVRAGSHRAAGKDVFPFNRVRVKLLGIPAEQAGIFAGPFFPQFLEQELRAGLEKAGCRFPGDLVVEVETTPELPEAKGRWLAVETGMRPVASPKAHAAKVKAARLVVAKGVANAGEIVLDKTRVNIGRTVDVYRTSGPSRRNDLAFSEDNEINRTVSREHAHILFDKAAGEYRIFNDRSYAAGAKAERNTGLWIIREGMSQEVPRDARGVRLQAGDEIQLGMAVVRFVR